MTSQVLTKIAQDVVLTSIAQGVLFMTGLPNAQIFQGNDIAKAIGMGHGLALGEDMVRWWVGETSKLLNGQWLLFEDEALYNSLTQYLMMMFDVDLRVSELVVGVSPFGADVNRNLTFGVLGVMSNLLRDWLDANSQNSQMIQRVLHPTSLFA